jgi:hypothetical protein
VRMERFAECGWRRARRAGRSARTPGRRQVSRGSAG